MAERDDGEKTFDPTDLRLQRALEEGQFGFSSELSAALVLLAGVMFLWLAGPLLYQQMLGAVRLRLLEFSEILPGSGVPARLIVGTVAPVAWTIACCLGVTALVPALAGAMQNRFTVTFRPLALKPERLNPVSGFQRIFSTRSIVRLLTSLARAAAILLLAWLLVRTRQEEIVAAARMGFAGAFSVATSVLIQLGLATAALLVLIGVADLAWQKWKHFSDLKMSANEFRQEMREQEGDPLIKGRMRKLRMERAKKALAREIPRATVIVTNPTHFAVALRYDRNEAAAPVVIAKGADLLARRIIELAAEHGIPVVERKPVARFLYYRARVGQVIPVEIYLAVAEILNFVNQRRAA